MEKRASAPGAHRVQSHGRQLATCQTRYQRDIGFRQQKDDACLGAHRVTSSAHDTAIACPQQIIVAHVYCKFTVLNGGCTFFAFHIYLIYAQDVYTFNITRGEHLSRNAFAQCACARRINIYNHLIILIYIGNR